ncbi:MAG: PTS sugar transporter subunit IIA [Elusimicrobia bacterium]|nr:PTS sugar transporter subunit IIA [Elusimicrobiota bacterium]
MQLGVKDAARLLEVSEKTVHRWIDEGRLPAYRVNEEFRFNRAELLEWATSQKVKVSPHIYREVDGTLPILADALELGGLAGPIRARDKAEALRAAVSALRLPEQVDRAFLLEMLLAREALCTTGIGEGVAVPHAKNPVVLHVDRPMVKACYLDPAVDFGAADGLPVHTIFVIISTSIRAHLHLLSRLAYLLHDEDFKSLLARRAPEDLILTRVRELERKLAG